MPVEDDTTLWDIWLFYKDMFKWLDPLWPIYTPTPAPSPTPTPLPTMLPDTQAFVNVEGFPYPDPPLDPGFILPPLPAEEW